MPPPLRSLCWPTLIIALAMQSAANADQWRAESNGATTPYTLALVESSQGDRLVITRSLDSIRLEFDLASSIRKLDRQSCPTVQIDEGKTPHFFSGGRCEMTDNSAIFELGEVIDGKIESVLIDQLMNGSDVKLLFITHDGAYHRVKFGLGRSKQAIKAALGDNVEVVGEPR
ncbi:MAG: hypothetical protein AAF384_06950 [Pseudomonadota bacterium]